MKQINLLTIFALTFLFVILSISITSVSALTITSVNTDPEQVAPGQIATLSITVNNNLDSEVKNVNVALDFSSNQLLPIAPYQSSSEQSVDKIRKGKDETFEFRLIVLPQAPAAVYKIPVKITYTINDQKQEKNSVVGIVVNSEPKLTISSDGALIQGVDRKVNIKIVNNGLSDLKFVSVELQQPSNTVINPPLYQYIGTISSDDFNSVDYNVKVNNNNIKSVSLPVLIKFKDAENKDYIKTETLSLPVYSEKEAIDRGLIQKSNTGLYIGIIIALIIIYIIYRVIRGRRKRKGM